MSARIHPSALVEDGVEVGEGSSIWDAVHVRSGARIGAGCIVGEKTYIAGGVVVGDLVKINAMAYLCAGVTLERGVMVAAGVIFTNDRYPRATTPDLAALRPSEADEDTLLTVDARIDRIAERSLELLSDESRQTLLQLLSRRRETTLTGGEAGAEKESSSP